MKHFLSLAVFALFFASLGAGGAVGVMVWEPWADDSDAPQLASTPKPTTSTPKPTPAPTPKPTPYERRLTAPEAAAIVESSENQRYVDAYRAPREPSQVRLLIQLEGCETVDFNERSRAWIVQCLVMLRNLETGQEYEPGLQIYRIYDSTGVIEPVTGP